ncbi:MAG: choloylglycine hydrolase family protein [Planctomycetaceae bacterium]|nr:choloylglycine hydrolase family protein [Planctomycetaceae bacterium]
MKTRTRSILLCALVGFLATGAPTESPGCTDFRIKAADGTVIIGRTMDFEVPALSFVRIFPRGERWSSDAPGMRKGMSWTSRYGYVAIDMGGRLVDPLDRAENLADGLNEEGLSFGWLSMPDFTTYQDQAAAAEPEKALAHLDVCPWVLGNFATVDEVKAAFAGVHVWGKPIGPMNLILPLHASVHDASGRSIVLEFTKEGPKVYDNLPGVLTNAPTFDWHMINIRNFVNLKAMSAGPIPVGASVLSPIGSGSGLLGIPGDWTPPSRFVRIAAMGYFAMTPQDAEGGVILAEHLLGSVTIPRGLELIRDEGPVRANFTRWSVIKDLRNQVLYFRGYDSHAFRAIHLPRLDLRPDAKRLSLPMPTGGGIIDVTGDLKR